MSGDKRDQAGSAGAVSRDRATGRGSGPLCGGDGRRYVQGRASGVVRVGDGVLSVWVREYCQCGYASER